MTAFLVHPAFADLGISDALITQGPISKNSTSQAKAGKKSQQSLVLTTAEVLRYKKICLGGNMPLFSQILNQTAKPIEAGSK